MSPALFAIGTWGFGEILVAVVIIAAIVAVAYVALQHFGIVIPPVIITIFWICVVAALAILAIRFLLTL